MFAALSITFIAFGLYKFFQFTHEDRQITKAEYYGNRNPYFLALHGYDVPKGPKDLSLEEAEAIHALKEVPKTSILGECIHTAIRNGKYKQLITELQQQIQDAPIATRGMIGVKAFEAVSNVVYSCS